MKTNTKKCLILIMFSILIITGVTYFTLPRFNIAASNEAIKEATSNINNKSNKSNKKVIDKSYVAKISVKNKINDVYVYDNASEETLFNKGAGIQEDISTGFKDKDYTFIKGHVETTFNKLDQLKKGDIIKVTLKDNSVLKYKVSDIHEEKYNDNNEIYTYTNKVGLSISTCSKNSINKQFPEKVLVVDSTLII